VCAAPTHLTPAIGKAYSELLSIIHWIDENGKVLDISGQPRSLIAAACFDAVLEHQAAIATLVERQLNGSALALMRVVAEAYIRGAWFARCATDDEVQRFQKDELEKGIRTLVRELEASLGNANDVLSRTIKNQWNTLCSFTHTGFKQVTRRYTGSILKPNYPEAEVIQALNFAGAVGILSLIELAALSKNLALGHAALERARQFAAT
jgi:hypothetical protein